MILYLNLYFCLAQIVTSVFNIIMVPNITTTLSNVYVETRSKFEVAKNLLTCVFKLQQTNRK